MAAVWAKENTALPTKRLRTIYHYFANNYHAATTVYRRFTTSFTTNYHYSTTNYH